MSDIETVIVRSRKLETLLREQYCAQGKGLHQLITSCEDKLPRHIIGQLRFIATIRNKVVHQDGYRLDDKKSFLQACKRCEQALTPRVQYGVRWIFVMSVLMIGCLVALFFYRTY